MREIKFRAWDKSRYRMVYDVQDIYEDDISGHFYGCFGCMLQSNYLEIMQYTGLKDKNGKEIYEGDILSLDDVGEEGYEYMEAFDFTNIAVVVWNEGRFELDKFAESDNSMVYDQMCSVCHEEFIVNFLNSKVIGNIYENKELLKEKETKDE